MCEQREVILLHSCNCAKNMTLIEFTRVNEREERTLYNAKCALLVHIWHQSVNYTRVNVRSAQN